MANFYSSGDIWTNNIYKHLRVCTVRPYDQHRMILEEILELIMADIELTPGEKQIADDPSYFCPNNRGR